MGSPGFLGRNGAAIPAPDADLISVHPYQRERNGRLESVHGYSRPGVPGSDALAGNAGMAPWTDPKATAATTTPFQFGGNGAILWEDPLYFDPQGLPPVPNWPAGTSTFDDTSGSFQPAAWGDRRCDGYAAGCGSGGTYGTTAMYIVQGRHVCRECAVKMLGLENESPAERLREMNEHLWEAK